MTFNIPYVMIKNIDTNSKLLIETSKCPCHNDLSVFLKCITKNPNNISEKCKDFYKNYINCINNKLP